MKIDLQELTSKILEAARAIEIACKKNEPLCHEENLRIKIEELLKEYAWSKLGVPTPTLEYRVDVGTYVKHYGRIDSLYGLVLFEYKKPYPGLRASSVRNDAINKILKEYIPGLLRDDRVKALIKRIKDKGLIPYISAIIIDGLRVIFIEYNVETKSYKVDPEIGYYELNPYLMRRIIRLVLASWRRKLDAKLLASEFGYASDIAKRAVEAFYEKLENAREDKTRNLFNEWVKLASQAYPITSPELKRIASYYGFPPEKIEKIDGAKLFYAIQTYYSIILKLLAAEVASRFYDSALFSFIEEVKKVIDQPTQLKSYMTLLEDGYVYSWYGIKNFIEGGMFSWYLDEWDKEIYGVVKSIIDRLSEFDIEFLMLNPSLARDVFKLLYEELIPREEIRKYLGFYTTPDWLAELILDELGIKPDEFIKLEEQGRNPLDLKFLDPAVGTGTFLTLVIQRIGEYLAKRYSKNGVLNPKIANTALKRIVKNVIGFDIDVLAVLTARTNYLIALAATGLLEHKGGELIEIPIYLANSIITAEEEKVKQLVTIDKKPTPVEVVKIETTVDTFVLPYRLLREGIALNFLSELRECIENKLPFTNPRVRDIIKKYGITAFEAKVIEDGLYNKLLKLEKENLDKVWIPIIKSHIVPTIFREYFDYLVGNPPWIPIRDISNVRYQYLVKNLASNRYSLVVNEKLMPHIEMATLFFIRSMHLYLRDKGLIGFVMPKAIYSGDHHDRFRRNLVKDVKYKFMKIIDCENVKPLFYAPACAIIAAKDGKTEYPIPVLYVRGNLPKDKHKIIPLSEAKSYLKFEEGKLYLNIIGERSYLSTKELKEVKRARSYYYGYFYQGATIVPQPCWFVDIIDLPSPNVVVVKTSKRAIIRAQKSGSPYKGIIIGPLPVERDYLFGVFTSNEIVPFAHLEPNIAVLPVKARKNSYEILEKEAIKEKGHINMYKWLEEVEKVWKQVRKEKEKKFSVYEWLNYQNKLAKQNPSAKYAVVYARAATNMVSAIIDISKVQSITHNNNIIRINGVIFDNTLYRYYTDNKDEAFYLCAVLNSSILDGLVKPMKPPSKGGKRWAKDFHKKPLEFPIPKFNPSNDLHKRLAALGKEATLRAKNILEDLLRKKYGTFIKTKGFLDYGELGDLRDEIRVELKDILTEIDSLVLKLFTESNTALFGREMLSKKNRKLHKGKNTGTLTLEAFFKKTNPS